MQKSDCSDINVEFVQSMRFQSRIFTIFSFVCRCSIVALGLFALSDLLDQRSATANELNPWDIVIAISMLNNPPTHAHDVDSKILWAVTKLVEANRREDLIAAFDLQVKEAEQSIISSGDYAAKRILLEFLKVANPPLEIAKPLIDRLLSSKLRSGTPQIETKWALGIFQYLKDGRHLEKKGILEEALLSLRCGNREQQAEIGTMVAKAVEEGTLDPHRVARAYGTALAAQHKQQEQLDSKIRKLADASHILISLMAAREANHDVRVVTESVKDVNIDAVAIEHLHAALPIDQLLFYLPSEITPILRVIAHFNFQDATLLGDMQILAAFRPDSTYWQECRELAEGILQKSRIEKSAAAASCAAVGNLIDNPRYQKLLKRRGEVREH